MSISVASAACHGDLDLAANAGQTAAGAGGGAAAAGNAGNAGNGGALAGGQAGAAGKSGQGGSAAKGGFGGTSAAGSGGSSAGGSSGGTATAGTGGSSAGTGGKATAGTGGSSAGTGGTATAGTGGTGTAGTGGTGQAGAGSSDCSVIYVSPNGDDTNDGCSVGTPVLTPPMALERARLSASTKEIRLCGPSYDVSAGLVVDRAIAVHGGYDCAGWSAPANSDTRTKLTFVTSGDGVATLVRVDVATSGKVEITNVDFATSQAASAGVATVGLDLVQGDIDVRRCRITPAKTSAGPPIAIASIGVHARGGARTYFEELYADVSGSTLATDAATSIAAAGFVLEAQPSSSDGRIFVYSGADVHDAHVSGPGRAGVGLVLRSGARALGYNHDWIARSLHSDDGLSEEPATGVLIEKDATFELNSSFVAVTGALAGGPGAIGLAATGIRILPGGELSLAGSTVTADGASGGVTTAIEATAAFTSIVGSTLFGGGDGEARTTRALVVSGTLKLDHATLMAGRAASNGSSLGLVIGDAENATLTIGNSLVFSQSDAFTAFHLASGCKVKAGLFSHNGVMLVGSGQTVLSAADSTCVLPANDCATAIEALFPAIPGSSANVVVGVPGASVCGSTSGTDGIAACVSPGGCLDSLLTGYSQQDGGRGEAHDNDGLNPTTCTLVRGAGGLFVPGSDSLDKFPADRGTMGSHQVDGSSCP